MRQPMTNGLALLVHSSVHQKLNRVSSVTSLCKRLELDGHTSSGLGCVHTDTSTSPSTGPGFRL